MSSPLRLCRAGLHRSSLASYAHPILFLSMILPTTSYAQVADLDSLSTTDTVRLSSIPSTGTISTLISSTSTSIISGIDQTPRPTTNSTTPSDVPGSPNVQDPGDNPPRNQHADLLNYYFVFLALLGVFIAIGVYLFAKRRKRRKLENRTGGETALARDLTGWTNGRRWIHGSRRAGDTERPTREEGLNENGEAPPPYVPKVNEAAGASTTGDNEVNASRLSIPLATLTRDGRSVNKPPRYEETIRSTSMPTGSVENVSRPETAATQRGESSRGLLNR